MNIRDIALHVLGAIVIMALGWWLGIPTVALVLNAVIWPAREWWQKFQGDEDYFFDFYGALGAIFTRKQPLAEWVFPIVAGFIIYGAM